MEITKIKKEEIRLAAEVLVSAFTEDPIFLYIFGNRKKYLQLAPWKFTTRVRWSVNK